MSIERSEALALLRCGDSIRFISSIAAYHRMRAWRPRSYACSRVLMIAESFSPSFCRSALSCMWPMTHAETSETA